MTHIVENNIYAKEKRMRWLFLTLLLLTSCEKKVTPESIRPVKTIEVKESASVGNKILLDRKKETSNQLKAELTIAQGDLDQATDNLSYTSLKAPFDGIIAAIYVENHEQVRAKQVVLRYLDLSDREMEINVPEKYING